MTLAAMIVSRTKRRTAHVMAAVLFLSGFAVGVAVLPTLDMRPGDFPSFQQVPELTPPGDDTFFVYAREKELSHPILYYGLGRSIEQARDADILLVGNSRTQLGLSEKMLTQAASQLGLKIFNMAVGHGDGVQFAIDVIRRHDLRPRVLVVNGGPFIFHRNHSSWAREVIRNGPWEARKTVLEVTASWWMSRLLHGPLPRIEYFDGRLTRGWVHHRSSTTGWWHNLLVPPHRYPVTRGEEKDSFERALVLATELKGELDMRGTTLVLSVLPYTGTEKDHLSWLSDRLGTEFVLPSFDGMETADGSHLAPDSAERISSDYWERFIRLPSVRTALGMGEH